MTIKEKITECKTMPELDSLRIEIVKDRLNFLENQQAFIKKKEQLRRISRLKDRMR